MESILLVPKEHIASIDKLFALPDYVHEIHQLRLRLAKIHHLQRKVRNAHLVWNNPCRMPKNHAHAELILEQRQK